MRASRRHSLAPRTDGHALVVSLHERCIRPSDIAIEISYFGPESHWIGFLISIRYMPAAVETGREQMIMGLEGRRVPQFARRTAYNERALCVCRDNARLTHAEHLLLSSDLLQMQHTVDAV